MADATYTPPEVWKWDAEGAGQWASINRPISGATHEKELPVGKHPHQLYSLATPNGVKVTIMFEELLAMGKKDAEYDAWLIRIMEGDQFGSGFVSVNPNSKIPAMLDVSTATPTRVFESGAILFYLAEKFDAFLPTDPSARAECMSWLFWQMGSAPYLGGGFGHFYQIRAGEISNTPSTVSRWKSNASSTCSTRTWPTGKFLCGDDYNIADIATYAWYGNLVLQQPVRSRGIHRGGVYKNVVRWATEIQARPAVQRGRRVNKVMGPEELQLPERHDASDLD